MGDGFKEPVVWPITKNVVLIMQLTSEVDAGLRLCQPNGARHFSKHNEMLRKMKRARTRLCEQRKLQQFCIFNVASYSTISLLSI